MHGLSIKIGLEALSIRDIAGHGETLDHEQWNLVGNDSFPSLRTFDKVWNI